MHSRIGPPGRTHMHDMTFDRETRRRRTLSLSIAGSLLLLSTLLLAGCSDDDNGSNELSAQDQETYCRNVADTAASLKQVREQLPAAIQQSNTSVFGVTLQQTRNDLEALSGNAATVPGASAVVTELYNNLQDYQNLLTSNDPVSVLPQIEQQGDEVTQDLVQLGTLGDCPAQ